MSVPSLPSLRTVRRLTMGAVVASVLLAGPASAAVRSQADLTTTTIPVAAPAPTDPAAVTTIAPAPAAGPTTTVVATAGAAAGADFCASYFDDKNNDGQQQAGEAARPNVTVKVTDAAKMDRTAVTNATGEFCVNGLASGDYQVTFSDDAKTITTIRVAGTQISLVGVSEAPAGAATAAPTAAPAPVAPAPVAAQPTPIPTPTAETALEELPAASDAQEASVAGVDAAVPQELAVTGTGATTAAIGFITAGLGFAALAEANRRRGRHARN